MRHGGVYVGIHHAKQVKGHDADDAQVSVAPVEVAAAAQGGLEPCLVERGFIRIWRKENHI